jgi:flavin reductase (DIM6/NTAB) family NADH-FMN oxidoreductase RutF
MGTRSVTPAAKRRGAALRPRRSLPLARVYQVLEPGPTVLLITARAGRPNVMPMSWHTMLEFEPPLVGCVVGASHFSFAALKATRECVIAVPTAELALEVVRCGNCSGRDVDKFAAFGLQALPAKEVDAPLVAQCYANLECRVVDTRFVPRYGLFVLEVVHAWIDPSCKEPRTLHHRGWGRFMVAGPTMRLPSRMR